jgi:hypothetical protein
MMDLGFSGFSCGIFITVFKLEMIFSGKSSISLSSNQTAHNKYNARDASLSSRVDRIL